MRVMRSRLAWAGLGVSVVATLAIVAFMSPVRDTHSRSDPRPDAYKAQLKNGWVTNCAGPAFSRFSLNGEAGPGPDRPIFKINDQLVLAVPKQNLPAADELKSAPSVCGDISDLPSASYLYFVIRGNWSAGYKPEDIPVVGGGRQFQPDVATVRIERDMPELRSAQELQRLDEIQLKAQQHDSAGTREIGGLTCLVPKPGVDWVICSGSRSASDTEVTRLRYREYGATPFNLVLAEYASPRYGIRVYWKAWISDISHALDIDREIWNSIEEWNLLNKLGAHADAARATL
jgi:hypothetical protein